MSSMISAIEWVPAGVADPNPKKYELSTAEQEMIEMMQNHNLQEGEDVGGAENVVSPEPPSAKKGKDNEPSKQKKTTAADHGLPADLRMDEYSDDDENDAVQGAMLGQLLVDQPHENMLADEESEGDDDDEEDGDNEDMQDDKKSDDDSDSDSDDDLADVPDTREYTPIDVEGLAAMKFSQVGTGGAQGYMEDEDDDNASDADDVRLAPDDALLVVAKTEEDFASLEVHVYEQTTGNMYVHHDVPLPSFPLCLAHGDIGPTGNAGNFCAVGTFSPGIEIWNLDVLNALEPSCVLGGEDTSIADDIMKMQLMGKEAPSRSSHGAPSLRQGSHTDAVMALSWNKVHRQVIASGSADCTVKLWDVTKAAESGTFAHHKDKVQSVVWHPSEGTLLATGSYDRSVALLDARSGGQDVKKVKLPADCEALQWDPFHPEYLTAASEDGSILCWDVRKFSKPVWTLVANEYGGVSDISYNPQVPGMLATCAVDKTVTLWDTYHNSPQHVIDTPPQPCGNKGMGIGKLYTINFYPSSPWLMGCAGAGVEIALWDMNREANIQKRFGARVDKELISSLMDQDDSAKQQDFEAMMTPPPTPAPAVPVEAKTSLSKKKKKGGNKKKKAHRAGR